MKLRKHIIVLFISLFLLAVLCTACTGMQPETQSSSEGPVAYRLSFEEVMAEINAKHASVTKPVFDLEAFEAIYVHDKEPRDFFLEIPEGPETPGLLSVEQMKRDAYMLMYYLRTKYSLYDYYGGDEKFDMVLTEIEDAVVSTGEMDYQAFCKLLFEHLSFISDKHFTIDQKSPSNYVITAFYREVAFGKNGGKFVNLETGKAVKGVDGFPELDVLFRLSLSDDYQLVYYPIVQVSVPFLEMTEKYHNGILTEPADMITIIYSDDSTQNLGGFLDYRDVFFSDSVEAGTHETQGIPIVQTTKFDYSTEHNLMMQFLEDYRRFPSMAVDLRKNGGGYDIGTFQWLEGYAGQAIGGNRCYVFFVSSKSLNEGLPLFQQTAMENRLQIIDDDYVIMNAVKDVYIDNPDRLLIVLMSKGTASAAEAFIDYGHNVENVLFVGDASAGCLENNMAYSSVSLTYSHIPVSMGNAVCIFPDETYFREGRGFLPDIWVPATEAEDLICGYLQKMQE